jgi:hypothetical protein
MSSKEFEITRDSAGKAWSDDDWIIVNLRDTGYYLTNYDETLWGLITTSLADNEHHEDVHFLNRGTLFADSFRFMQHDVDFRSSIFLELADSLKHELHPHVWRRANNPLRLFETRFRGTETHQILLNFLKDLMSQIYGRTFENNKGC